MDRLLSAPALALYAWPDVRTVYPYHAELDAESKARADRRIIAETVSYQTAAIERFQMGASNRRSIVLEGNTTRSSPTRPKSRLMREFLSAALPR